MGAVKSIAGGLLGGAPKAPSAGDVINQSAQANRINQITPTGNLQYGTFDENGNFVATPGTATVKVSQTPEQDYLRSQRYELAKQFGASANPTKSSYALQTDLPNISQFIQGLPGVGTAAQMQQGLPQGGNVANLGVNLPELSTNYDEANQRAADAIFQRGMNYAQPGFDQDRQRLEANLAAQGIPVGSEAYQTAVANAERNKNQALENLMLGSITAGNQEAGRLFGQDLAARGQLFGEQGTTFQLAENQQGQRFNQGLSSLTFDEQQRQNRLQEQINAADAALRKQMGIAGVESQRAQLAAALGSESPMFVQTPQTDVGSISNQAYNNRLGQYRQSGSDLGSLFDIGSYFGLF